MTFREVARTRECNHCGKVFVCGSLSGARYCSQECKRLARAARRHVADARYKAKDKRQVAADERPIPHEVLALGEVETPRPLGRSELVAEVRRLTAGSDEEFFEELIDEWSRSYKPCVVEEIRAVVLMLGGEIEATTQTKQQRRRA